MNVDTFFYKIGQSRDTLTSYKTYMQTATMASATLYIAIVGGTGTDSWRWSSRLGNHVSLALDEHAKQYVLALFPG